MLTEEQHKDYNIFKGLILGVSPEFLDNKIVNEESHLKYIFSKDIKKTQSDGTPEFSFPDENKIWDLLYNLDKFLLEGPFFISHDKIKPQSEEIKKTLQRFYDLHIKEDHPFWNVLPGEKHHSPLNVDFKTLPPIILNEDYSVWTGNHRTFLAKKHKSSIRAYKIVKKPNNHPNIPKIKSYLI